MVSVIMKNEGVTRILASRRGCGVAVVLGDSTGTASVTRGARTEGAGLKATAPKDRKAGLSVVVAGEGTGVV